MQGGWGTLGGGAWGGGAGKPPAPDSDDEAPRPAAAATGAFGSAGGAYSGSSFRENPLSSGTPPAPAPAVSQTSSFRQAFLPATAAAAAAAPPSAGPMNGNLAAKEAELKRREADLVERERKVRQVEADLRASGAVIRKRNWPPCYPVRYHNISEEIPEGSRRVVREMYLCWLGLVVCLCYQVFTASVMLGQSVSNKVPSWFLTIIYLLCGVPMSLWLWYFRIYNAARDNSRVGWWTFFFFFAVNLGWCVWCAIAIPVSAAQWSFNGFATAFEAFSVNNFAGVVFIIGSSLWVIESLWCLWCLKDAWFFFRSPSAAPAVAQGNANKDALAAFRAMQQGNSSSQAV